MASEQDYQKLKEVMEFPCRLTFKIAGMNREGLVDDVVACVQRVIKGDYQPREKQSSKGTYNSVSIDVTAQEFAQVEQLYKDLAKIDGVKMVL